MIYITRLFVLKTVVNLQIVNTRTISTSNVCCGRRNFRKFPIPNKRGIFEHRKLPKELLENEYNYPVAIDDMKIRYPGVWFGKKFVYVKEMEPEIIVPADLEATPLKPYVSYRVEEVTQSEFTAEQLFNATYGREIVKNVNNKEPIPESLLVRDESAATTAKNNALKTGSDIFNHTSYFGKLS